MGPYQGVFSMSMKLDIKVPTFLEESLSSAPTTSTSGRPEGRPGPAMSLQTHVIGVEEVILNLGKLSLAIKYKAAMLLSAIGIDLLSRALPLTPVDTGKLREEGEVVLQFGGTYKVVATGSKEGNVISKDAEVPISRLHAASKMNMIVQFYRTNEFGEDIALWAHEDLNYSTSQQRPHALTPGTGPKYLETPWINNKGDYVGMLYELANLRDSIKRATKITKYGKSKTAVAVITLDTNKLLEKVARRVR